MKDQNGSKNDASIEFRQASKHREVTFMLKLAKSLHAYGLPAHRLEDVMTLIAGRLGFECDFFVIPTGIFGSLTSPSGQETFFIRVLPGDVHLEKQCLVDQVVSEVMNGARSPEEGGGEGAACSRLYQDQSGAWFPRGDRISGTLRSRRLPGNTWITN